MDEKDIPKEDNGARNGEDPDDKFTYGPGDLEFLEDGEDDEELGLLDEEMDDEDFDYFSEPDDDGEEEDDDEYELVEDPDEERVH